MIRFAVVLVAFAAARVVAAAVATSIRTDDGLALSFAADGRAASVQLDGRELPLAAEPGWFRIRDAATAGDFVAPALTVTRRGESIEMQSGEAALGLDLHATIRSRGGYFEIDGEIATRDAADRCVDLKISIPVEATNLVLGTGLFDGAPPANRKKAGKQAAWPRAADAEVDEAGGEDNALYPICPVSGDRVGLSLAVPPTHPTRFLLGRDATGPHLILRIGLSAAASTPGRTAFRVIVYRHDPRWGFRSALARYYEFHREDFFTRRVKRIGAWTTQNASRLRQPQYYAYHEAGFAAWRHPAGTDSGVNVALTLEHLDEGPLARTLDDYERLCELALDEKLGIYSLPYTIVGQRQLLQLPALPKTYDEAMQALERWSPRDPILFDGPPQAVSFRTGDELKEIIRNSSLHDPQHRLAMLPRPYRGPTLTFPQNPNPSLFRREGKPTIASYTLDYYIPKMFESRFVDGIYLDSLGRWCGYYNFRTEHFKDSTVPLTYHGDPPQVCLWNLQSTAEYMWEARRRLHARGAILMANGVHPERVMLGFACDVLGREGAPAYTSGEPFYALRVTAGEKPYCLLNAKHHVSARLWNSCLYMGYLMGCNVEKDLADEAKYLPLVIKCNEAGWEPVTHARATPASVGVERWGGRAPDGPLLFTVMNRSNEPVTAELAIDVAALRRNGFRRAAPLLPLAGVETRAAERLVLRFRLGPEEANVFELRE